MHKARVSPTPSAEGARASRDVIDSVAGFMHNNVNLSIATSHAKSTTAFPRKNSKGYLPPMTQPLPGPSKGTPLPDHVEPTFLKRHFGDLRTGARSVFALLCCIYSFVQIIRTSNYYFEFDTGVAVAVEEPAYLKEALPGTTLCNKNLVTLEAAFANAPGFKEADEMIRMADSITDERERKRELVLAYEGYMSTYYAKFPVKTQLDHGPRMDDFLQYLRCNTKGYKDWYLDMNGKVAQNFECEKVRRINTAQGKGNCITMFHDGAKVTGPAIPLRPQLANLKAELEDFVPKELFKLVLDFGPENYTDLRMAPGGEIMFHDERTVPLEASLSYTLKPGKYYQFYLKKSSTRALLPPYKTNCTNYYNENAYLYIDKDNVNVALKHPLSETVSIFVESNKSKWY